MEFWNFALESMDPLIFKHKRVLITGHTGFKGGWLVFLLKELGATITGYSLPPDTQPSFFEVCHVSSLCESVFGDIRDFDKVRDTLADYKPEIVFHLAAQPLVRRSYLEPRETYETNVMGTLNVLEAARMVGSVSAFINVTSDKCYLNREKDYAYQETDPFGGYDIYSSSKACSEILTASYRQSFLQSGDGFLLASARAGNVIGGGDWSEDRLIPDCVRALSTQRVIEIRNPLSIRPWQHVLEPLKGYLMLAESLLKGDCRFADGFNFGPDLDAPVLTVQDVVSAVISNWGSGEMRVDASDSLHEAVLLQLDSTKATQTLGWKPHYSAYDAIERTMGWYKRYLNYEDMQVFTKSQIREYLEL